MADDLRQAAEQARQQSDLFLQRSREQMYSTFASQRAMGVGTPAGNAAAGVAAGAGGSSMMAGTPAGKVLEAINAIIRKGIGIGAGGIGGPLATAGSGMGAIGSAVAGGAGFMAGNAPFGPGGMGSGALEGMQNRMSSMQMLFTAFGGSAPGSIGRFAGARMDMTAAQAQEMAQEEVAYRGWGGAQKGLQKALNVASIGMFNYTTRRAGLELEWFRGEDFNRSIQQNMRFMTRENLERGGYGKYASAFATGITREGAAEIGSGLKSELNEIQRQTGASAEQLIAIQGRGMGTMGALGLNKAMAGGAGNFKNEVMKNVGAVREIQQSLKLSEEEADQFFRSMGQIHGTATRIAEMARTSRRAAGRMGMDVRDVFGIVRQFEDTGRLGMTGQAETGAVGLRMAERFRGWQQSGMMNREESMMYGGRTQEEGLKIMTQKAYQAGTGLFEAGRLGGMGLLMRYNQGQYNRFAAGGMGALEAAGAVGGMVAADPLTRLRGRYDEKIRRQTGEEGLRTVFGQVQAMKRDKMFLFGGKDEEMFQAFERRTGMQPLESKKWFQFFDREKNKITQQIQGMPDYDNMSKGERSVHEQGILALHNKFRSEGSLNLAKDVAGGNEYEAVGRIYREGKASGLDLTSASTTEIMRKAYFKRQQGLLGARISDAGGINAAAGNMSMARSLIKAERDRKMSVFSRYEEGTPLVSGTHLGVIGKAFESANLTKSDVFKRLLTEESGESIRDEVEMDKAMWNKLGFDAESGTSGSTSTGVVMTTEKGTDLLKKRIGVTAFGEQRSLKLEDIARYLPDFYKKISGRLLAGTKGLGTASGMEKFLKSRGTAAVTEAGFRETVERGVMERFRGTAGALFGAKGAGFNFGEFSDKMLRGVAAGSQEFQDIMTRMPEVEGFLSAARRNADGTFNYENIRKHLGDKFKTKLADVTGLKPAEIVEKLARGASGLKDLLSDANIKGLLANVLSLQGQEATPLGSVNNAIVTTFSKEGLANLTEAITDAIKLVK
jgi:hypothetical protein